MHIKARIHHGVMIYPFSSPQVKVRPPSAGPEPRPMAEKLVAKPLRVPRTRRLNAEFVKRMVEQGKAKMTATHLTSINTNMTACWVLESCMRAVNGVSMYTIGKTMCVAFKQLRTP